MRCCCSFIYFFSIRSRINSSFVFSNTPVLILHKLQEQSHKPLAYHVTNRMTQEIKKNSKNVQSILRLKGGKHLANSGSQI